MKFVSDATVERLLAIAKKHVITKVIFHGNDVIGYYKWDRNKPIPVIFEEFKGIPNKQWGEKMKWEGRGGFLYYYTPFHHKLVPEYEKDSTTYDKGTQTGGIKPPS